MPEIICERCRTPVQGSGYPQKISDYPDCWIPLKGAAARARKSDTDTIRRCNQCGALWYIKWDMRDAFLNAFKLPDTFLKLCGSNAAPGAFLDAIKQHTQPGPVRSLLIALAGQRFVHGSLNGHADLLLDFLSDTTLPMETVEAAVILLDSVFSAAVAQAFPESMAYGSPDREALTAKLREQVKDAENLVDAAEAAHEEWSRERRVQHLPPLQRMDITPLMDWLTVRPDGRHPAQVTTFRSNIRELLMKMAKQANRKPPVLTVATESKDMLKAYRDADSMYKTVVTVLKEQAKHLPEFDELELSDTILQLNRLLLAGPRLDGDTASILVTLRQSLEFESSKPPRSLLTQIDQLLLSIKDLKGYPATVKKRLQWFLRDYKA